MKLKNEIQKIYFFHINKCYLCLDHLSHFILLGFINLIFPYKFHYAIAKTDCMHLGLSMVMEKNFQKYATIYPLFHCTWNWKGSCNRRRKRKEN